MSDFEDEFEMEEGTDLASEVETMCPYCGESLTLTIDPLGGNSQEYVEDCPVCCQPWQVHVTSDESGGVQVTLDRLQ